MAVNKPYGDGRRIGAVKNRTQVLNLQTFSQNTLYS